MPKHFGTLLMAMTEKVFGKPKPPPSPRTREQIERRMFPGHPAFKKKKKKKSLKQSMTGEE